MATLGHLCPEAIDCNQDRHGRSLLFMQQGDNPKILLSSLRMSNTEMHRLDIVLEGPSDVVFSVDGPFDVHLVGYIFDDNSSPAIKVVPQQTCANEGGSVASTSLLASSSKSQLPSQDGGGTCKLSTESAPNPDLSAPSHQQNVDISDGLNKFRKEGSINVLLQGMTEAEIEDLRNILIYKLQDCANEGGSVASTSLLASSSKSQLPSQDGGGTCKLSTELAPNPVVSAFFGLKLPNLSHLQHVDFSDRLNKYIKEGSTNGLLQGLTVAQIKVLKKIIVYKLAERRLECYLANEEEDRVIGHTTESGFNGNEVEERVEQVATQGTAQVNSYNVDTGNSKSEVEAEVEHVANYGTTHVIDTNEESGVNGKGVERSTGQGSSDHHVLRSRKVKRLKLEEDEEEKEDEEDEIRSTKHDSVQNPMLDSKEARRLMKKKLKKQKQAEDDDTRAAEDGLQMPTYFEDDSMRSTQHGLPENSEVDTEDAIKSRKKRKKDDARGEARSKKKHDPLQNPLLDSKEAKRLKKKLKKQKHAEDDDTRAANDGLRMPTYSEDDINRSAQHGLPEDFAVRGAEKANKKKKEAGEVRAANDDQQTPAADTLQTTKDIIEDAHIRSHEAEYVIVCALPFQQGKR